MAALAGGIAALILGIIGIIIWWGHFIELLMGAIPLLLILGGALAGYLGFEEIRDKKKAESFEDTTSPQPQGAGNLEGETAEAKGEEQKPAE